MDNFEKAMMRASYATNLPESPCILEITGTFLERELFDMFRKFGPLMLKKIDGNKSIITYFSKDDALKAFFWMKKEYDIIITYPTVDVV